MNEANTKDDVDTDMQNTNESRKNDRRDPSMGPPAHPPPKEYPSSYNGYNSSSRGFRPYNNSFSDNNTGTYAAMNRHPEYRDNGSAAYGGTATSIRMPAKIKTLLCAMFAMNVVVTVAVVAIWTSLTSEISSGDLLVLVQQLKASNPEVFLGEPGPQGPQGIQGIQGDAGAPGVAGALVTVVANAPISTALISHGITPRPSQFTIKVKCVEADGVFLVGDILTVGTLMNNGAIPLGVTILEIDSSTIKLQVSGCT